MSAPPAYPMVDRAYYDARIFDIARQIGAKAINVYAWDHYLQDVNGFCGGWTPAVVAQIYALGFDCHFVFCFRDGDTPVDPATCVSILKTLGARPGAIVHDDIEGGAMDSLAHDLAFTQAVQQAGFRSAPYGLASTLRLGYLQGAYSAWVASYVAPWNTPPALANVPNVGAYDEIGWQFSTTSPPGLDVDVSTVNYTIGGGNAPPGGTDPLPIPHTMKRALALMAGAALRHQWASDAEVEAWAAFIHDDGTGYEDLLVRMEKDQGPGITYDQPPPPTPGPAGPPGPPGPAGPAGHDASIPAGTKFAIQGVVTTT